MEIKNLLVVAAGMVIGFLLGVGVHKCTDSAPDIPTTTPNIRVENQVIDRKQYTWVRVNNMTYLLCNGVVVGNLTKDSCVIAR